MFSGAGPHRFGRDPCSSESWLFMAALCNRGALYFCPVVSFYLSIYLLLLLVFIPRLISAVADWMSTIFLHMVWP